MNNEYFSIKIPGKTFISGEYLALSGGSSLLVSTEPGFQVFFVPEGDAESLAELKSLINHKINLDINSWDDNWLMNSHSPAGKFYQKNLEVFKSGKFLFYDGY